MKTHHCINPNFFGLFFFVGKSFSVCCHVMWVWGRIRRKQKMGWDKQADIADATSGKLDPAGPLVALMASCKPVILRLCVINKWIPAPEVSVYQPGKWEHSGF